MGWQYWELWEDEWPYFAPHWQRMVDAFRGRYPYREGEGYWMTLSHAVTNARKEHFVAFAYTKAHLPPGWLVGFAAGLAAGWWLL